MKIGGIYREHQLLFQPKPNPTKVDAAQLDRWNLILNSWILASNNSMCTVIGDMNLDFLTWNNPEPAHRRMIERTRDNIETLGFLQVIRGHTREWRGQVDSLLDHCWLNKPERLISTTNTTRGKSDHNYISVILKTKDKIENNIEVRKRVWRNFCPDRFRQKVAELDWTDLYRSEDINIINDIFETKLGGVLETEAPLKYIQGRKNYVNWLDDEMSQKMKTRDQMRKTARERFK